MVGRTEGTITSWYAIIDEGAELWEVYSNGYEVLRELCLKTINYRQLNR